MAARSLAEPQGRPNKFTDVGVVGRKTGLMVKDTGRRDSAGLEDMDAFFSPTVENQAKKTGLLSAAKVATKFQNTIQNSARNTKDVLASRKSLLAQHRTPQKTFLKSPAVRVQTPKQGNQNSPRVKRLLSFMELDNDFEDHKLGNEEPEPMDSPTQVAKPVKRKGLTQQSRPKRHVFEETEQEESMAMELDVGEYEDGGYALGDDSFGQDAEQEHEEQDTMEEDLEEESFERPPTPPVKRTKTTLKAKEPVKKPKGPHSKPPPQQTYEEEEEEEQYDEEEELIDHQYNYNHQYEEEEEEEDLYGQPRSPPPPQPQPKPPPQSKKPKKSTSSRPRKQPKPSSSQPQKRARTSTATRSPKIVERREKPHPADISTIDGDVRRSTRIKVPPLAHWRNERIVYELESRRQSGPSLPKIKEIIRIDTPPHPSRATASAIHAPPRGQSRKRKVDLDSSSDDESDAGEVYATIKAFDEGTVTGKGNRDGGMIADYRIAVAKSAMNPQPLLGRGVHFQKLFQDGGYVACGIMDVVVGGVKATKPTRHSYMTFAVMRGKVEVKVNRTAFVIGKGGVFVVPRGNVYSIKNVGDKDCRLFWSQAVEDSVQGAGAEEDKREEPEE